VRTVFVDTCVLKGFPEPVPVYRVEQTHRSRVIAGQYIVITNLRGFTLLVAKSPMAAIERILNRLFELHDRVCRTSRGTNRFEAGDSYCLTFPDPGLAMAAMEYLKEEWDAFEHGQGLGCPINIIVHKGDLYAFRSFLYGNDLNIAALAERAARLPRRDGPQGTWSETGDTGIFVTGQVRRVLEGTPWDERLQPVAVQPL